MYADYELESKAGNIRFVFEANTLWYFTLNFVATLNRWESAPPALYKGPTTGFSDWINMLEANA